MKKIIIFGSQLLEKRNYYRYGFDIFIKKGWDITYCNLTLPNFEYDIVQKEKEIDIPNIENVKIFNVSNLKKLKQILDGVENYFYADFSRYSFLKIYANLKLQKKNTRLEFQVNRIPKTNKKSLINYFNQRVHNFLLERNKLHKLSNLFMNNLNILFMKYIYKKSILFYAGENLFNPNKYLKIISIHTMDFDFFIKDKKLTKDKKFISFIDQYLDNHPDFSSNSKKTLVTKENYYKSINKFFSFLEKKLKKKVVIAIHPRAPFDNSRFENKEKFFYDTYNTVKNSELVVTSYSTAVNFICILKKPAIFIYTDEIAKNRPNFVERIKFFAETFGTIAVNIDDHKISNLDSFLTINEKKYDQYFVKYISDNKDINYLFWEKVILELEKY